MTVVNWTFHGYGHRFGWDLPTLTQVITEAGFTQVTPRSFGESAYPGLALDRPERAIESMYVEATAPTR